MKNLICVGLAATVLTALSGCPTTPTGGGTGGGKDNKFDFNKVLTTTTVKQGGAEDLTLNMNRGKDFKQPVKLTAENVPDNVKVTFSPSTIKAEDEPKSVMKIEAAKDAALAESKIRVKATPDAGSASEFEVPIKVVAP